MSPVNTKILSILMSCRSTSAFRTEADFDRMISDMKDYKLRSDAWWEEHMLCSGVAEEEEI